MIDFHCHIDLYSKPEELIDAIDRKGIYVLAVTTTPKSWMHLQFLLKGRTRIRSAVGLHPELVAERSHELNEVIALLPQTRYVGEIGLDGSPAHRSSFALQQKVFSEILNHCAAEGGKILSIHSRAAASAVLDCLEAHPGAGLPVLHWFSGSSNELIRATQLGCWFSVGPTMLKSAKGRALVEAMPRDRLLTESDGPFTNHDGLPLTPLDMLLAESALSTIWQESPNEVAARVKANFKRLVSIPHQ